jgi:Polyketide cyclase / dehydrase and lipid transport
VLTYEARSDAAPEDVWTLMAQPALWPRWAPHIRGAWGLGAPEVQVGRRGLVRLLGAPVVPARITGKRAGRMWAWKVGPVELTHRVERRGGGSTVAVDIAAPRPVEAALRATYGPLVQLLVRRLGRVAARAKP